MKSLIKGRGGRENFGLSCDYSDLFAIVCGNGRFRRAAGVRSGTRFTAAAAHPSGGFASFPFNHSCDADGFIPVSGRHDEPAFIRVLINRLRK